ncbi:fumarylacetoacetase [Fulvivirga sediminis]|uniref:fumarylacetoacetase n=1 Tax=Fulvivirga sediminis TaxID=2803949 RepID=A0A937F700_9BACT|nr:fumarylacetoacetase [Fulvivirga sediminis]MBL3656182.1 fumarylacetoacetase [Fulvivirga sediminis]
MKIKANNPSLKSWVAVSPESDFPIQNLPFGIFKTDYLTEGAGVAIGEYILDLTYLHENGFLDGLGLPAGIFNQLYLNSFIGLGKKLTRRVRNRISELLNINNEELRDNKPARELALIPMKEAVMLMPVNIPNYTDFYSNENHAANVGAMFRDKDNALMPNWKHLPVGYHGRASSIVPSGANIHRPKGQLMPQGAEKPIFGASKRLDFELEMAFITCKENGMGNPVSTVEADEYIFGFVLFNDWSARDIQFWEYVPLGPFLAKSFASSISPWIVTADALEPYRTKGPEQEPAVLPYLQYEGHKNYDIDLEVHLQPEGSEENLICSTNFKYMYWNVNQQLAHQTINGCNLKIGDMYASGTISGPDPGSYGSMLELSWKGTKPVKLTNGAERKFLEDGDTIIMKGRCQKNGVRLGFGALRNTILPSK